MQTGQQQLPVGIDLGNHSSKVAALGRTGTQVLPNSLSNRETPTLVSLGGDRRLVGEAATTQRTSNAAGTLWNIRALLGRVCLPADSAAGSPAPGELPAGMQLGPSAAWQSFQLTPTADGGIATVVGGDELPLEAVAAACLGDCIATVKLAAEQGLVRDGPPLVALAAPTWAFTASQRAALANAATIAGIDVVDVLSEAGAAGLFYATERLGGLLRELGSIAEPAGGDPPQGAEEAEAAGDDEVIIPDDEEEGEDGPPDSAVGVTEPTAAHEATVVFVDIGHGGTSASLVAFDSEARTVRVLDTAGTDVGGREIDVLMAERFQEIAEATQPGLQLSLDPSDIRVVRARQRIFAATDESKKVLSANDSDTAMLEELAEGLDVRCNTTREELEEMLLSSGVLDAMMAPVEQVLQRAAAAGTTVHALELYGGTSRVPLISAHVSALLEHHVEVPLIRRSMNGSEAVARGCALHAAMALPTFNDSRRIRLTDTTPYDISAVLTAPPPPAAAAKGEASKLLNPEAKPPGQHLNRGDAARHIDYADRTVDKPVLNIGRGSPLPSPMTGSPSARLRLSDVSIGSAVLNLFYTDTSQLPTTLRTVDASSASSANMPIATYRLDIVDGDLMSKAVSEDLAADDSDDVMAEIRELLASEVEYGFALGADLSVMCFQRGGPKCELVALKTAAVGVMSPDAVAAATKAEEAMAAQDAAVEKAEAARNSLESAIYRYRDEVLTAASDGQLDDETRATLEDALMASEDWLYEEETYEITDATVFEDRLAQVQSLVGAHLPRAGGGEGGSSDGPDDEPLDDDDLS